MNYITFQEVSNPGHKTKMWDICSASTGLNLGSVFWRAGWRKYVFSPISGTIFDCNCLDEISVFISAKTWEQKNANKT